MGLLGAPGRLPLTAPFVGIFWVTTSGCCSCASSLSARSSRARADTRNWCNSVSAARFTTGRDSSREVLISSAICWMYAFKKSCPCQHRRCAQRSPSLTRVRRFHQRIGSEHSSQAVVLNRASKVAPRRLTECRRVSTNSLSLLAFVAQCQVANQNLSCML